MYYQWIVHVNHYYELISNKLNNSQSCKVMFQYKLSDTQYLIVDFKEQRSLEAVIEIYRGIYYSCRFWINV